MDHSPNIIFDDINALTGGGISIAVGILGVSFYLIMMLIVRGAIDVTASIGHVGSEQMISFPALIWMQVHIAI